ncbi:MAG: SDR family NAD(P)-dependent oxidoreductase, partial [Planctomycetota bacterium]
MNELSGRRALVCGSTQGIGRACAHELAHRGAAVTLVARNEAALRRVQSELSTAAGQIHHTVGADFGDPQVVQERVAAHV